MDGFIVELLFVLSFAVVVDAGFPEASVVDAGFPEASVVDDENNENGSKLDENKSLILVVPPNSDEFIIIL
jgi:hypothetical protein